MARSIYRSIATQPQQGSSLDRIKSGSNNEFLAIIWRVPRLSSVCRFESNFLRWPPTQTGRGSPINRKAGRRSRTILRCTSLSSSVSLSLSLSLLKLNDKTTKEKKKASGVKRKLRSCRHDPVKLYAAAPRCLQWRVGACCGS